MPQFSKMFFLLAIFFSLSSAQAAIVQEGNYRIVSDTCYDREGQAAGTCDPSWKTSLQEMKITVNQGRNPLDGSIYVVPLKQTVPAFDPTVPTGYFANYSLAQTDDTTYVYEDVAWVGNKFVGESERGRFEFQFRGNQLVFSVFGASFVDHGATVRKIRMMVFEK